ncbi:MAG TPA: phage holin family protein [Smithellaceae bacterium]|nr:phage holin family protein [Smithellaceae bacterium]
MLIFITRWLVITVAILAASWILSGIHVDSVATAIIAAAVLGLVNIFIRPILLILTLPLTILTLGIFAFLLNAFLLAAVAYFIPGFEVEGFFAAFMGAIIISVVSWIANRFIQARGADNDRPRRPDVIDMERGDDGKWR